MTSDKYYGNLTLGTFFTTKGSGESDLGRRAGSHHMVLYDAGITDYSIMVYSSILPATARFVSSDEVDMPPFGSELKITMSVLHDIQDELVSAGVVYAWMCKDENFGERAGGPVCEVNGRHRIGELKSRLIRVISDPHQNTYSQYYLDELSFITEGVMMTRCYGTTLTGLCFADFMLPESPIKDED